MKFIIYGDPIAKKRARHARRGNFVITYDEQEKEKNAVTQQFVNLLNDAFDSENKEIVMKASKIAQSKEFCLDVWFHLPIPKSDNNSLRNAKLWGLEPCNHKPDLSNLLKFYEDAANSVLFPDDSMIVFCTMHKKYSKNPRTEIEIMPNKELNLSDDVKDILKIFGPEDIEELVDDAKKIASLDTRGVEEANKDFKEIWFSSTSSILNQFAKKYADKMKKISKFNVECKTVLQDKKTYLLY